MRSTQRSPGSFTCESAEISFGSAMIHLHASPVDRFSYASSPYSLNASFAASSNEPGRCRSDRWAEGSPITPRRQAPGSPGALDASGPCPTFSNTTGGCATKTVVAHPESMSPLCPAARCRARGAVPRDRRAPRGLPRNGPAQRGRLTAAGVRGTRVQRLPYMRSAGARLRAPAVHRLRVRAARAVLLQGPGLLPELRRGAADGGGPPHFWRGGGARGPAAAGGGASLTSFPPPPLGLRPRARRAPP